LDKFNSRANARWVRTGCRSAAEMARPLLGNGAHNTIILAYNAGEDEQHVLRDVPLLRDFV